MAFAQELNRLLERVYDFRGKAGRREVLAVFGVSFLYSVLLAIPAAAFLLWLANYGSQFEFADQLTDAVFTPLNIAFAALWGIFAVAGSLAFAVANVFTAMRRLNDLHLARSLAFLYLVPVLNLLLFIFLLFVPGRGKQV